jgi:hypothetical protein
LEIPGGTLLNPTTPEEQDLAALREGDKSESRANGKEPIRYLPSGMCTMEMLHEAAAQQGS